MKTKESSDWQVTAARASIPNYVRDMIIGCVAGVAIAYILFRASGTFFDNPTTDLIARAALVTLVGVFFAVFMIMRQLRRYRYSRELEQERLQLVKKADELLTRTNRLAGRDVRASHGS